MAVRIIRDEREDGFVMLCLFLQTKLNETEEISQSTINTIK